MRSKWSLFLFIGGLLAGSAIAQTSFQGIGIVPGAPFSQVHGISGDGSTLVVRDGAAAALWEAGVRTNLGAPNYADDASFDGSVAVGGINNNEAAFWNGSWNPIGYLNTQGPPRASLAFGISASGDELAGFSTNNAGVAEAFLWSASTGMQGLGFLSSPPLFSAARGLSADGRVAVGYSEYDPGRYEAFRWTQASGMQGLGVLLPDKESRAFGISADGSTIVGMSGTLNNPRSVMWPPGSGPVALGPTNIAYDASATGRIIVGGDFANLTTGGAWMWSPGIGAKDLQALLAGVGAAGWTLQAATAISDDGCIIGGYGLNPQGDQEGWVATFKGCGALRIRKDVLLAPGDQMRRFGVMTYRIEIASVGVGTVLDFIVEDLLVSGLNLLAFATDNGSFDPVTGRWLGSSPLDPGDRATLLLQVQADSIFLEPVIKNCATVIEVNGVPVNSSLPGHEACIKTDYKHSTPRQVDLLTTKEGKVVGSPGSQQVIYAIKVGSSGPSATTVELGDLVHQAGSLIFVSATATAGTYDPVTGIWDVGILAMGQSQRLEVTYDVAPGFSGTIDNSVFTSAPLTETSAGDNAVTFSVTVP